MAKILYPRDSFYKKTKINTWYLDIWEPISIPESGNDIEITIPSNFHLRPDLASYNFYNTPKLWFVFALRNKDVLKDPIFDFRSGLTIVVPPKELIRNIF